MSSARVPDVTNETLLAFYINLTLLNVVEIAHTTCSFSVTAGIVM